MEKCVIVGAGECDASELNKQLILNPGDMCIGADGGIDYLSGINIKPDLVIGDMDSVTDKNAVGQFNAKILPVEKDDTDMLSAIKEGLKRGYKRFELYGSLGGSFDHTYANIQCLMYLINNGARGVLIGNGGLTVTLIHNEAVCFNADEYEKGRRISVFSYGEEACGVSETGLKYTISNAVIKHDFPIGVSNEFTGGAACIEVKSGTLIIYIEKKKK